MTSVGQRQMKTQVPADRKKQPDPPLVETNEQRFQWENAVLRSTKSMQHEATAVAFYLSKSWRSKLGYCFPAIEAIAFDLGISESAAWRSVRCLGRLGFVVIKKGTRQGWKHSHNIYYLALQDGALFRRKLLKDQEIDMAELPTGHYAELPSGEADAPANLTPSQDRAPSDPSDRQNCLLTNRQSCLDNYSRELQGAPPAPPTDSTPDFNVDAREADPPQDDGALDARPDAAFRAQLEPCQLTFYDQLEAIDQYRYRKIDADRRDAFAAAWEHQHEVGDEADG